MAHEIGHNLGMDHDHAEKHGGPRNSCDSGNIHDGSCEPPNCVPGNNIMSYGYNKQRTIWSKCSKSDFQALYLLKKNNWCMEGKTEFPYLILYFHENF